MKCKGVIFDMDGVLFDTERVYQETWHEIAAERQMVLDSGFLKAITGTSGATMLKVVEQFYHVSDGAEIISQCMKRIQEKLSVHVPLKKGVREILEFFREENMRIAIASSSSREQIESNLGMTGLCGYFDEIVSGREVAHGKPAPDIFLRAAEMIGCRPEECFVFEDSANGVKAGNAAGCVTIMVPDLIAPSPEIEAYCSKICPDLGQAMEEIKNGLLEK